MTKSEIYTLAMKNNYQILYRTIQMHNYGTDISWEEAMEQAAIELSKLNAELTAEILRIHETSVVNIIDGKLVHINENICNAPGCTNKKRGAT